jgi:ribosomal subunit interface protein
MRVQIVARQCEVPPVVRDRTQEQIPRLARFDQRLSSGEVIFEEQRHLKKVEGVLSVDGQEPVVARGEGTEFRPALDQMLERLQRILRRRRDQSVSHKGPKPAELVEASPELPLDEAD